MRRRKSWHTSPLCCGLADTLMMTYSCGYNGWTYHYILLYAAAAYSYEVGFNILKVQCLAEGEGADPTSVGDGEGEGEGGVQQVFQLKREVSISALGG